MSNTSPTDTRTNLLILAYHIRKPLLVQAWGKALESCGYCMQRRGTTNSVLSSFKPSCCVRKSALIDNSSCSRVLSCLVANSHDPSASAASASNTILVCGAERSRPKQRTTPGVVISQPRLDFYPTTAAIHNFPARSKPTLKKRFLGGLYRTQEQVAPDERLCSCLSAMARLLLFGGVPCSRLTL